MDIGYKLVSYTDKVADGTVYHRFENNRVLLNLETLIKAYGAATIRSTGIRCLHLPHIAS